MLSPKFGSVSKLTLLISTYAGVLLFSLEHENIEITNIFKISFLTFFYLLTINCVFNFNNNYSLKQ